MKSCKWKRVEKHVHGCWWKLDCFADHVGRSSLCLFHHPFLSIAIEMSSTAAIMLEVHVLVKNWIWIQKWEKSKDCLHHFLYHFLCWFIAHFSMLTSWLLRAAKPPVSPVNCLSLNGAKCYSAGKGLALLPPCPHFSLVHLRLLWRK